MTRSANPFRYFNSSPEVIRLVVMMYIRYPLSLRSVEDLLFECGVDICHETVRFWWNRFGLLFAADMRRQRVSLMRGFRHWRWRLGEVLVQINGERHYLWRAVDYEREILESFVTKKRDKSAASKDEVAAKFASVHACMQNHFNQERHLVDCQTYNIRRPASLAEWQSLACGGWHVLGLVRQMETSCDWTDSTHILE